MRRDLLATPNKLRLSGSSAATARYPSRRLDRAIHLDAIHWKRSLHWADHIQFSHLDSVFRKRVCNYRARSARKSRSRLEFQHSEGKQRSHSAGNSTSPIDTRLQPKQFFRISANTYQTSWERSLEFSKRW